MERERGELSREEKKCKNNKNVKKKKSQSSERLWWTHSCPGAVVLTALYDYRGGRGWTGCFGERGGRVGEENRQKEGVALVKLFNPIQDRTASP